MKYLLIPLLVLLAGCPFVKQTSSCEKHYSDPVYVKFCESDLVIEAAKREVQRQKALGIAPLKLMKWETDTYRADRYLNKAEEYYRLNGAVLAGETEALESMLDKLEVWLNESE